MEGETTVGEGMIQLSTLTMARAHLNSALEAIDHSGYQDRVLGAEDHVFAALECLDDLDQDDAPRQRLIAAWQAFRKSASENIILVSMLPGLCSICVDCAAGEELDAAFTAWLSKSP